METKKYKEHMELVEQARELAEFFTSTYAEEAILAAISTRNDEVLRLVVQEYQSQRQLIEEHEDDHSY